MTIQIHISSLSPDEAVMPESSPSTPYDNKTFQDILRRLACTLEISVEIVQKTLHKLLDILHNSVSGYLVSPINDGLFGPHQVAL